ASLCADFFCSESKRPEPVGALLIIPLRLRAVLTQSDKPVFLCLIIFYVVGSALDTMGFTIEFPPNNNHSKPAPSSARVWEARVGQDQGAEHWAS
ncbi:hypothetical protein ACQKEM_00005, partial [Pseudomonas sp. NPDC077382]